MTEEKKQKIREEEDFIDCPRFKNSAKKLLEKYPEGVDADTMAKVLLMSEEEIQAIYLKTIQKIKNKIDL